MASRRGGGAGSGSTGGGGGAAGKVSDGTTAGEGAAGAYADSGLRSAPAMVEQPGTSAPMASTARPRAHTLRAESIRDGIIGLLLITVLSRGGTH